MENWTPITEYGEDIERDTTLKSGGVASQVPHNTWEATATNRVLWRHICLAGLHNFKEKRCNALILERLRRNATQPPSNIDTFLCRVCGHTVHHGSACIVTTEHTLLTKVEISHTDCLLQAYNFLFVANLTPLSLLRNTTTLCYITHRMAPIVIYQFYFRKPPKPCPSINTMCVYSLPSQIML